MGIHNLIYQATAKKRKRVRNALACRFFIGLCVVTAAASLGVAAGVLIVTKPGEDTRQALKKSVTKSVDTIKKAVSEIADDKEKD